MLNERVEALRLLYAQATPEEQAAFPGLLRRKLYQSNGRTLAHVAVEIGILPGDASAWLAFVSRRRQGHIL